ncbi:MAG: hypothetical protein HC934_07130 [Acaryochloridaceae cyanobacterium SU_2_1]|nr:hypothetical protein [Acaryochloridaceae cyanobacterium SU_2_1]
MKSITGLSALTLILCLAPAAYADQCSYVSKSQAIAAFNAINLGQNIYHFCENCGDRSPKTEKVQSLSVANTTTSDWQVLVNGKGIDLAYTYIEYRNDAQQRLNLALLAACPASGFTPLLPPS